MKTTTHHAGVRYGLTARFLLQRARRLLLLATLFGAASSSALAGSVVYQYDSLGRLAKATYSNGVVITYSYDAAGNRTSYTITGAPT